MAVRRSQLTFVENVERKGLVKLLLGEKTMTEAIIVCNWLLVWDC